MPRSLRSIAAAAIKRLEAGEDKQFVEDFIANECSHYLDPRGARRTVDVYISMHTRPSRIPNPVAGLRAAIVKDPVYKKERGDE